MNDPSSKIAGASKLLSIFGKWPSFHDAEIVAVTLDRGGPTAPVTATLRINLFETAIEYSDEIHYEYVLKNDVLAEIVFREIQDIKLDDFNHQNVIYEMLINPHEASKRLAVEIDTSFGMEASFTCSSIEVLSVLPMARP